MDIKALTLPLPLELLQIPQDLDGHNGGNRGPASSCQLAAGNDLQAIETWLAEFRESPQTFRHYRKEAERLLLWALLERGKPLSGLNREDFLLFEEFLKIPTPKDRWCGSKAPRFSSRWRPFSGPLSASSRRTALLVINSLMTYLVKGGYLSGNPLALVKRKGYSPIHAERGIERFLEHDQWQVILETVDTLPNTSERERKHYQRTRFLVALLYLLGPRVSEIASHSMGSFIESRGHWWWVVTGKGKKTAKVPVNRDMLEALQAYRRSYGLQPLPIPGESTPLVMNLNGTSGISDNMIYRIIKKLVCLAATRLDETDPWQANRLRKASTHWFRHTSITHQADAGIGLNYLRRSARHAKLDTTNLYLHVEDAQWHEAMEMHRLRK